MRELRKTYFYCYGRLRVSDQTDNLLLRRAAEQGLLVDVSNPRSRNGALRAEAARIARSSMAERDMIPGPWVVSAIEILLRVAHVTCSSSLYRVMLETLSGKRYGWVIASEAVSRTLVKLVERIDMLGALDAFEDEGHEKGWLIKVTMNSCKDIVSRKVVPFGGRGGGVPRSVSLDDDEQGPALMDDVSLRKSSEEQEAIAHHELMDAVWAAVSTLPPSLMEVVQERYGGEGEGKRSVREVAETLGLSEWVVRGRLEQAYGILRRNLMEAGYGPER